MIHGLRCAPPIHPQQDRYAHLRAEFGSINPACWSWEIEQRDLDDARNPPEHFAHILLWNWQRGQCAICAVGVDDNPPLVRDHDHATGLLRGLLCETCNSHEGFSAVAGQPGYTMPHNKRTGKMRSFERWRNDDKNRFMIERCDRYRAVNPASMLGLKAQHSKTQISYGALMLPERYEGDLPIFDVSPYIMLRFHKAAQVERGKDNRLPTMYQMFGWYAGLPGYELPERPPEPIGKKK